MRYMLRMLLVLLCFATFNLSQAQTVDCSSKATWAAATAYNGGSQVKYNGVLYTANWWTQGNQPDVNSGGAGSGQPWTSAGTCSTASKGTRTATITSASSGNVGASITLSYTATPTSTTGTWSLANGAGVATLSGNVLSLTGAGVVNVTLTIPEDASYNAATATMSVTSTTSTLPIDCGQIGIWDSNIEYVGGNQVKYNSSLYQAKFWTKGNQPDVSYGTAGDKQWTLVGICNTGGTAANMSWTINGNNNLNSTSFIGTTLNTALRFRANGTEHMRLHPFGTLQLGGMNLVTDGYFKLDVTGRVALRPDPGVNQNNVLLLYSNNQTTTDYTSGYRHYTGFSHVLLGATEVGVINTVDYNSTSGVTRGKHLLLQNTNEGNLAVGVFSIIPNAKFSVNGNTFLGGTLGVGTTYIPTGFKVAVDGKIIATEVHVKLRVKWPDYVFSPTYKLMSLDQVGTYIKENKHLPNVPSAQEVGEQGVNLGNMNAVLLEKIEELTLYLLDQNETIQNQQKQIEILQQHMNSK